MKFSFKSTFFFYTISLSFITLGMECNTKLQVPQITSLQYMPWREQYQQNRQQISPALTDLTSNAENQKKQCVFCRIPQENSDDKNYIPYRGKYTFVTIPTAPYVNNGFHFLIIPYQHGKELSSLPDETYNELNSFTKELCERFSPQTYQTFIGLNLGPKAGATIPEHLHRHMVFDNSPPVYSLIQAIKQTNKILDLPAHYKHIKEQYPTLQISRKKNQTVATHSTNSACTLCARIGQNNENDKKNLILYRGKNTVLLFEDYPSAKGHIAIAPIHHNESVTEIPTNVYEKINKLTIQIYPLLLKVLGLQDIKIGMNSYTNKSETKEHIRQHLVPCQENTDQGSYPTMGKKTCLTFDVEKLYDVLREEIKKILEEK